MTRSALPPGYRVRRLTRTTNIGNVSLSAIDHGEAYSLSLSDLPDYAELVDAWDLWRIEEVEFTWYLARLDTSSNSQTYPVITSAVDYTDSAAPATENEMLQRENMVTRVLTPGQPVARLVVKPRVNQAVYQGITTGYGLAPGDAWMATANPDIRYYGMKSWYGYYNTTYTPGSIVNVRATVKLAVAGSQ
jgi:hypothetical protein